uniref:G_PROTEIN_RECEP_F1_2 domain-containing protein n=1 Tax=Steinernema glaseri TaxID=37863 RepID=A0A1I7YLZ0_9BILA
MLVVAVPTIEGLAFGGEKGNPRTATFTLIRGIVQLLVISIMALFYLLSLNHIFFLLVKKASSGSTATTLKPLRSILIYCTPPNLMLVVAVPEILCTCFIGMDNSQLDGVCAYARDLSMYSENLRIFITSVCALVAFRDYRLAFLGLFKMCFRCCRCKKSPKTIIVSSTIIT